MAKTERGLTNVQRGRLDHNTMLLFLSVVVGKYSQRWQDLLQNNQANENASRLFRFWD